MVTFYRLYVQYEDDEIEAETFWKVHFRAYVKTFFRETSLEGFAQVLKQPGIVKKLFWIVAMLLCLAGLVWELYVFCGNFLDWRTTTTVSVENPRQLYFPAITICNNNPVTTDGLDNMISGTNLPPQSSLAITTPSTQSSQTSPLSQMSGPAASGPPPSSQAPPQGQQQQGQQSQQPLQPGQPPPRPNFTSNIQESLAIQARVAQVPIENRGSLGHQLCDMVLQCRYGGVSCHPGTNFTTWHWSPTYGNCFTFNAGYLQKYSPSKGTTDAFEIKKGDSDSSGIRIATTLGETYGLYLLLNADVAHYLTSTTTTGWRIVVHNQTDMPFPDESGILVGPGMSTRITMGLQYTERLGVIDNYIYKAAYSNCINGQTLNLDDNKNAFTKEMEVTYSEAACSKTCYQRAVMANCSCFDFNYPKNGPSFSSVQNAGTLSPCAFDSETQWRCKESVALAYRKGQLNCACPEKCTQYSVDTSVSAVRWPNTEVGPLRSVCETIHNILAARMNKTDATCTNTSYLAKSARDQNGTTSVLMKQLRNCMDHVQTAPFQADEETGAFTIGKQFAEVYVYYKDFKIQTLVEKEWIEFADLLAYLGGILGLFYGFTFFTFFEYVQFFIDCIGTGIAKLILLAKSSKISDSESSRGAMHRDGTGSSVKSRSSSALSNKSDGGHQRIVVKPNKNAAKVTNVSQL